MKRTRTVEIIIQLTSPLSITGAASCASDVDVLNGVAHRPDSGDLLLTGKDWPLLFEVAVTEDARR